MAEYVFIRYTASDFNHDTEVFKNNVIAAMGGAWDPKKNVVVQLDTDVKLVSKSTAIPCFNFDDAFLGRNIYIEMQPGSSIYGRGGNGGAAFGSGGGSTAYPGRAGGPAITVNSGIKISISKGPGCIILGGGGGGAGGFGVTGGGNGCAGGGGGGHPMGSGGEGSGAKYSGWGTSGDAAYPGVGWTNDASYFRPGRGGIAGAAGESGWGSRSGTLPGGAAGVGISGSIDNIPLRPMEVTGTDLIPDPVVTLYNRDIHQFANSGIVWGTNNYPTHSSPSWFGGTTIGVGNVIKPEDLRGANANAEASDIEATLLAHIQTYARLKKMRIVVNLSGTGVIYDQTTTAHCLQSDALPVTLDVANSGPEPSHDAVLNASGGYGVADFIKRLQAAYNAARENVTYRQANICHSSCHNSCHGSRNRR